MGELRISSYSVVSDPISADKSVLMNALSGALDLVPRRVAEIFERSNPRLGEPSEAPELGQLSDPLVDLLTTRGHLTTLSHAEERGLALSISTILHEEQARSPQFMVVPYFDCNYRCTYCFERELQNGLKRPSSSVAYPKSNVSMDARFVPAIYYAIGKLWDKHNTPASLMKKHIILYGGEPLDKKNSYVVKNIVQMGKALGFKFSAITNGHDLDEYIECLGSDGIGELQISIDGPPAIHDRRRISVDGSSSFHKIAKNIRIALERTDVLFHLRVHLDNGNIGAAEELFDFFRSEGFLDHPRFTIYGNTVYRTDSSRNVFVERSQRELFEAVLNRTVEATNVFFSGPSIAIFNSLMETMTKNLPYRLRGSYCAANTGNYIFAPDWKIYSCWESVGKDCSHIGSFDETGAVTLSGTKMESWFSRKVSEIPECSECTYALLCGGGCAQFAEYNTGSIYAPFCDEFESMFKLTLADSFSRLGLAIGQKC